MNLAYPLADALLLGIVVAVLGLTGWRLDRTWSCIVAGTTVLALADSAFLYQAASGSANDSRYSTRRGRWRCSCSRPRRGSRLESSARFGSRDARLLAVPAVFGLTSLAILVYGQFESLNTPAVVLAATSMLAVIARMALHVPGEAAPALGDADRGPDGRAHRDRQPAQADGRPRREARRARARRVLLLLDLDGFKGYNDSFGHPAGDALLARLAKKLADAVAAEGEVYRIGGDEFCVLGRSTHDRRDGFASGAAEALQEHGEGFRITAAYGAVSLPEEAADVAEALRLVDGRMYDEKDGRRASAGRQSRDVLLRALYERDDRLQGHLAEIVELVRSVGRRARSLRRRGR